MMHNYHFCALIMTAVPLSCAHPSAPRQERPVITSEAPYPVPEFSEWSGSFEDTLASVKDAGHDKAVIMILLSGCEPCDAVVLFWRGSGGAPVPVYVVDAERVPPQTVAGKVPFKEVPGLVPACFFVEHGIVRGMGAGFRNCTEGVLQWDGTKQEQSET